MKLAKPRELAQRSLGLVAGVVNYVQASKAGLAPSPLLLVIRSANQLAERILAQPSPVATPSQRRTLQALATQVRAMSSRIIITTAGRETVGVEGELAELIRRTLELVDRVCAEPPALDRRNVIDVDLIER
ncbi:MAG TPA: hypothetical protein VER12_13680 [Polyangiaceae bacterium]|nr:hypothetical protein [Polyangiaceae bacterium]